MKKISLKDILIVIVLIYSITVVERLLNNELNQTEIMIDHNNDYIKLRNDLDTFNEKITNYEKQILENVINVNGMSNDELDDLFSVHNPR